MANSRAATQDKKSATKKSATPARPTVRVRARGKAETAINLHAYVPDVSVAKSYVGRKLNEIWDFEIVEYALESHQNILIGGPTGSGKTMMGRAFAAKNKLLYYRLPCDVSIDPSALFGKMQPTEVAGKYVWQDGPVTQLVRQGGVLNISEVNFMLPKIAASLYSLLDADRSISLLGHHGEVVRAHQNLVVIADMNPQYRGTMELNSAFKNRFSIKLAWGYSEDVEKRLVKMPTVREIAKQMRESGEIETPVSTNMLMEFERFLTESPWGRRAMPFAVDNFATAFDSSEQQAVRNVLDAHKTNLERDWTYIVSDDDDEYEEEEFEFEGSK